MLKNEKDFHVSAIHLVHTSIYIAFEYKLHLIYIYSLFTGLHLFGKRDIIVF